MPLIPPSAGFDVISGDLRDAAHATDLDSDVRALMHRAAVTIDDLDAQRHELEMALADARSAPGPGRRSRADPSVVDAITEWLNAIDPSTLEALATPAISRAFVEASVAAERVIDEAAARAEALIDFVAMSTADLLGLIDDTRDRPEVAAWHARFTSRARALLTRLRLPATVPVADLIELLGATAPR